MLLFLYVFHTFDPLKLYLDTSVCYSFVILHLVPVSCSLVPRLLAEDCCSNDRGTELLHHMTDYTQTSCTTASSRHRLKKERRKKDVVIKRLTKTNEPHYISELFHTFPKGYSLRNADLNFPRIRTTLR